MSDTRLALRVMRRQPGFTLVSITLIALAILPRWRRTCGPGPGSMRCCSVGLPGSRC